MTIGLEAKEFPKSKAAAERWLMRTLRLTWLCLVAHYMMRGVMIDVARSAKAIPLSTWLSIRSCPASRKADTWPSDRYLSIVVAVSGCSLYGRLWGRSRLVWVPLCWDADRGWLELWHLPAFRLLRCFTHSSSERWLKHHRQMMPWSRIRKKVSLSSRLVTPWERRKCS